ncbi:hypothetical protein C6T65_09450 [Burkholderia vietnamiensis]|uniref:ESPR domain-containing protein n=1 Tax=Burkholderia vietnamiensis TaxID=60552 RepID=A0AA45BEL7_BURVI|nr:hypothetical protein C6T65_09450 [Burkholderia vietnamiensis]
MNKIFKVIWCKSKSMFVVASELAVTHGASGGRRVRSSVRRADNGPALSRVASAVGSAFSTLSLGFGLGFATAAAHAQTVMPAIDTANAPIQTTYWGGGGQSVLAVVVEQRWGAGLAGGGR